MFAFHFCSVQERTEFVESCLEGQTLVRTVDQHSRGSQIVTNDVSAV